MMLKTFNRWAIVDYLRHIKPAETDPIFNKIADMIDSNIRPALTKDEEEVIEVYINHFDEYALHQVICMKAIANLRDCGLVDDDQVAAIVAALMLDTSVRYPDWERRHNEFQNTGSILHVNGATGERTVYN